MGGIHAAAAAGGMAAGRGRRRRQLHNQKLTREALEQYGEFAIGLARLAEIGEEIREKEGAKTIEQYLSDPNARYFTLDREASHPDNPLSKLEQMEGVLSGKGSYVIWQHISEPEIRYGLDRIYADFLGDHIIGFDEQGLPNYLSWVPVEFANDFEMYLIATQAARREIMGISKEEIHKKSLFSKQEVVKYKIHDKSCDRNHYQAMVMSYAVDHFRNSIHQLDSLVEEATPEQSEMYEALKTWGQEHEVYVDGEMFGQLLPAFLGLHSHSYPVLPKESKR